MTPEQFVELQKGIEKTIQEKVNGRIEAISQKLDVHNLKHEDDMGRMLPVIEAFEETKQFADNAKASGRVIIWIAGFITAVGAAWLMILKVFHS